MTVWILAGLLALVAVLALGIFNGLVQLRNLLKNSWADVDVYLKRRAELIPNLVTAVKAYASHESTLLEALAHARTEASSIGGPTPQRAAAETEVGSRVYQALILAEAYPDLKATANFAQLQQELSETEKLIASARQYYNAVVRDFNTKIESFPSSLVAGMMGLRQESFFELENPSERDAPKIAN